MKEKFGQNNIKYISKENQIMIDEKTSEHQLKRNKVF
jgi:hypothetical protein